MKKDNERTSPDQQPAGAGRISNIDGMEMNKDRDISSIDRQEGEMEHGETGGNFKKNETSENREVEK